MRMEVFIRAMQWPIPETKGSMQKREFFPSQGKFFHFAGKSRAAAREARLPAMKTGGRRINRRTATTPERCRTGQPAFPPMPRRGALIPRSGATLETSIGRVEEALCSGESGTMPMDRRFLPHPRVVPPCGCGAAGAAFGSSGSIDFWRFGENYENATTETGLSTH